MTGSASPAVTAPPRDATAAWLGLAREATRTLSGAGPAEAERRELLLVEAGQGCYAIGVERIREIVRVAAITRIPRTPAWLVGVVSLRGEIVEVVDLRHRLALPSIPTGRASRIVVLHGEREGVAAILVDSVKGVLRVPEEEVRPAPENEFRAVVEMVHRDGRFIGVLDLARILQPGGADA